MSNDSSINPSRAAAERPASHARTQGLTDAQLSAADRVLQRERSRSRATVRIVTANVSAATKHHG